MDLGVVVAILGSTVAIIGVVISMIFWTRSETNHSNQRVDAIRELVHAIHLEMKDFHNRLCDIERNRK